MNAGTRALGLAACVGAAAVAVAAGWADEPPELTQRDARRFVEEAFATAGIDPVRIVGGPVGGTYHAEETAREGVPVWRVRVELGEEQHVALLWIHRVEARLVNVDEGEERFLAREEFGRLRAFSLDDAADRQRRRDVAGTAAAALIAVVAVATVVTDRRGR